ncbi:holo-ACP synthase [Halomonas dongshanensis]|uniref:Holo-[acyl-carrier-protein] synthase n=1 Tax=Halomonas dongshanensis TaxID=2890835 RepID=A0ABT2EEU6_9GAMM|nr:holo-ACP synthase [Halomonas dongshanensis]MCS2610109.1 holo-ACP synthase [Halomonas dongshanensis]
MIVGIGSDIARIARFSRAMERHGPRFAARILGEQEQRVLATAPQPAAYLAKRFAAKEAFLKALGRGLRDGLQWRDVQVVNDALGKPSLRLSGAAAALAREQGVTAMHVTLSDEADYAVAFVVLER